MPVPYVHVCHSANFKLCCPLFHPPSEFFYPPRRHAESNHTTPCRHPNPMLKIAIDNLKCWNQLKNTFNIHALSCCNEIFFFAATWATEELTRAAWLGMLAASCNIIGHWMNSLYLIKLNFIHLRINIDVSSITSILLKRLPSNKNILNHYEQPIMSSQQFAICALIHALI